MMTVVKTGIPLFFIAALISCQTWTVVDDDFRKEIFISSPARSGDRQYGLLPCDTYTKGFFSYSGKLKKATMLIIVSGDQPMRIISLRNRDGREDVATSINRKINHATKCASVSNLLGRTVITSSSCTQGSTYTSTVSIPMTVSSLKGIEEDLELRAYTDIEGVFANCLYSAEHAKKFLRKGEIEAQYSREWEGYRAKSEG